MKQISLASACTLAIFLFVAIHAFATNQKRPEINGKKIVAMVGDEPITLDDFNRALSAIHSSETEEKQVSRIDYKGILNRLVNMKLVVKEARNIGLDELPEIKNALDRYSKNTLIGLLRGEHVKNIPVDEEEANKLYQEAVRELKIKTVLFAKEDEAKKIEEEIKAGKNFDDIVKRIIADGTAKGSAEGEYLKGIELLPQISEAVSNMEIGSVSPVIQVKQGYAIFKLEDIRFPENQEAKEQARQKSLRNKRDVALEEYKEHLTKKYAKDVDYKTIESINYQTSVEEFEKLLKDNRVLAEIEGLQPLTVGELTEALKNRYFHGVEVAVRGKKLNDRKIEMFDNLLQKRVFLKEALNQGIDKSAVYKNLVSENENSVLFDTFINKVIVPDIKFEKEELKKYYNERTNEYSSPEIMKIFSIIFEKRDDAESTIDRLRKGADFKWLSANTEGQVKDSQGLLTFEGKPISTSELPEEARKAVSGAKPGDIRIYESPERYFYVLYIDDVFPPKKRPFEEVSELVAKKVFDDKLQKLIEVWADKLKKAYKVKIYATDFND